MYACHSQSAFAFLIKVTNRFARFIFRVYTVLLSIRDLVAFVLSTYLSFGTRFFHLKGSLGPIWSNPRINTVSICLSICLSPWYDLCGWLGVKSQWSIYLSVCLSVYQTNRRCSLWMQMICRSPKFLLLTKMFWLHWKRIVCVTTDGEYNYLAVAVCFRVTTVW